MNKTEYLKRHLLESARDTGENMVLEDLTTDSGDPPPIVGGQWMSMEEITQLTEIGWPVAEKNGKTLLLPMCHAMIIGSTGRGKTTVGYQNIVRVFARMKKPPSLFLTDAKGDCTPRYIQILRKTHTVYVVNCMDPSFSRTFNSLLSIYDDYHEAKRLKKALESKDGGMTANGLLPIRDPKERLAAIDRRNMLLDHMEENINTITNHIIQTTDPKSMHWDCGARSMLKAIILASLFYSEDESYGIRRKNFHIGLISQIARSVQNDCDPLIQFLHNMNHPEIEQTIHSTYEIHAKQTRDSYISTLNTALTRYVSRCIQILSHSSTLDLEEIVTSSKPVAIFVMTDDSRKNTLEFTSMLFQTLVLKLKNTADRSPEHCLDRDFVLLLDEACNCSSMLSNNISSMISTLRSRKIWLAIGVQTVDQLTALYGESVARTIIDNCGMKMFYGSNNRECKEYFSAELGRHQVENISYSISVDAISKSVHSVPVPLVPVSHLERLCLGEFFVIHEKLQNVRLKARMTPFFRRNDVDHTVIDLKDYECYEQDYFDPDDQSFDIEKVVDLWEKRHTPPKPSRKDWDYFDRMFREEKEEDSEAGDEDGLEELHNTASDDGDNTDDATCLMDLLSGIQSKPWPDSDPCDPQ